jgi:hypothetical protein
MREDSIASLETIAWGVASRALPGETATGDLHLLKPIADGLLLSVVDGLGHGNEAATAAARAIAILESHAEEPLNELVRRCHEGMMDTRGAVMTLAKLHLPEGRLTWLGIGNVEAILFRAGFLQTPNQRVILAGGVVGYKLPVSQAVTLDLSAGDLLVFATDGVGTGFTEGLVSSGHPQHIADRILERDFKGTDDALVLVVRYGETSRGSSAA